MLIGFIKCTIFRSLHGQSHFFHILCGILFPGDGEARKINVLEVTWPYRIWLGLNQIRLVLELWLLTILCLAASLLNSYTV